ncbi:hypothetical protein K1T71_002341 [Dendrolimus kikuchii]|uniref:Uncharacterized protein n=1 Tax=Dendrolimus kikuchii TaxID=765133 RepID=A0ACC1DCE9_9NEOP|nr:hypothetical protein K1T71_002341 [Dendrolimus kikuchii]
MVAIFHLLTRGDPVLKNEIAISLSLCRQNAWRCLRTTQADGVSTLDVGSVAGPRRLGESRLQSRNGVSEHRSCVRLSFTTTRADTGPKYWPVYIVFELLGNSSCNSSHDKVTQSPRRTVKFWYDILSGRIISRSCSSHLSSSIVLSVCVIVL